MASQFLVKRDTIHEIKVIESASPEPDNNQVLLEIQQFAFTANNITYAVVGDRMGYWQFFPADQDGWGIIPVWGFATVSQSNQPDIQAGERIYGYFPMATHLLVEPGKVNPYGFRDMAEHRQNLNPVYNSYVRADATPGFEPGTEAVNSLLRPMFTTSFLLDDFFADNAMFGANTIILSSASSKTAYGTAFLLNNNRNSRPDYKIIGLTSRSNVEFVESLNCYDTVLSYDDAGNLNASDKAGYIDFSGNQTVHKTLHQLYQDNLVYDCVVGATHNKLASVEAFSRAIFFAPAQIQKRMQDWGRESYQQRTTEAWLAFIPRASNWIDVTPLQGKDAILEFYQEIVTGNIDPRNGFMLRI